MESTIAVYTANISGNDILKSPIFIADNVDYIYFTNFDFNAPSPWQVRPVQPSSTPSTYQSRYYFDQSCLVLPEYTYTIMHGANSQLAVDPHYLIDTYLQSTDIAAFRHPHRDCIYDEGSACISMGKDVRELIIPQMNKYRLAGYPAHNGLSACILLVRRNTPQLAFFEQHWYEEVSSNSFRDQLSFDYMR